MLLVERLIKGTGASEGVLLAAVPVLGTYLAFVFQLGYLWGFGVPASMIAATYTLLLDHVTPLTRATHPVARALGRAIFILVFISPLLLPAMLSISSWRWRVVLVGVFVLLAAGNFIPAWQKPGAKLSYKERLKEKQSQPETGGPPLSAIERTLAPVMVVAITSFLVFILGLASAALQISHVVLKDQPGLVYLTKHQDSFVFARYNETTRQLSGELLLLQNTSDKPLELIRKETGPLSSARCPTIACPE